MSFNTNRSSRDGKPNKLNKSNKPSGFNKDRSSRSAGSSSSSSSRDANKRPFDKDRKPGKDFANARGHFSKNDDKRGSDRKPFDKDRSDSRPNRDYNPTAGGRPSDRSGKRPVDRAPGSNRVDRPDRRFQRTEGEFTEKRPHNRAPKSFDSDRSRKPSEEGRFTDRPERNHRQEGRAFDRKPLGENKSRARIPFHGEDARPKRSDKPFTKSATPRDEPRKRSNKDFSIPLVKNKQDDSIRLNRFIANSGVCSRRKADELIEAGVISVNGEVVTSLGTKVDPAKDDVRYNGERLKREKMVYVLLNKPKDFITTTDDPQERRTVMHLVEKATQERIYPVGRLDRNTTGLLLMTNDGALAEKLSHPRNSITKIYHVELDKAFTQGDLNKVRFGLELEDGLIKPDEVNYVQGASKREIGIQIHSGKNRIVRRIFESLGYDVVKLDRVIYANLTKKDLPRGRWRHLEDKEVIQLKHFMK